MQGSYRKDGQKFHMKKSLDYINSLNISKIFHILKMCLHRIIVELKLTI